jgi:hypothetical protein
MARPGNTTGGKYHCTVDLLIDLFGLVCFTNKNENCQFQTSQTGGQQYSDTSPFSIHRRGVRPLKPFLSGLLFAGEYSEQALSCSFRLLYLMMPLKKS